MFQMTTDGSYIYLGDSINDLADMMSDNSAALAENTLSMLNNRVDAAEILNSDEFKNKAGGSVEE
jgi:hypothetical protein